MCLFFLSLSLSILFFHFPFSSFTSLLCLFPSWFPSSHFLVSALHHPPPSLSILPLQSHGPLFLFFSSPTKVGSCYINLLFSLSSTDYSKEHTKYTVLGSLLSQGSETSSCFNSCTVLNLPDILIKFTYVLSELDLYDFYALCIKKWRVWHKASWCSGCVLSL